MGVCVCVFVPPPFPLPCLVFLFTPPPTPNLHQPAFFTPSHHFFAASHAFVAPSNVFCTKQRFLHQTSFLQQASSLVCGRTPKMMDIMFENGHLKLRAAPPAVLGHHRLSWDTPPSQEHRQLSWDTSVLGGVPGQSETAAS